jgi:hypothetical protein
VSSHLNHHDEHHHTHQGDHHSKHGVDTSHLNERSPTPQFTDDGHTSLKKTLELQLKKPVSITDKMIYNTHAYPKALINRTRNQAPEDYSTAAATDSPLKLPDIKLTRDDPFNDPGQKTFISTTKVNNPEAALPERQLTLDPVGMGYEAAAKFGD